MATELERLVISLEAKTTEYTRALAKAQDVTVTQLKKIEAEGQGFVGRFDAILGRIGRGFTLSAVAAGVGMFVNSTISQMGELSNAALQAGTDVEKLQALIFAGAGAGVDQAQIVQVMAKLNAALGEAATKGSEFGNLLASYGIKVTETNGQFRDTVNVLKDIANAIANARSSQEALHLATVAFGEEGRKIIPILAQGGQALQETLDRAKEVGAVIDGEAVAAAKRFDTAIAQWSLTLKTSVKSAIVEIIASIVNAGKALDELNMKELERSIARVKEQIKDAQTMPFEGSDVVVAKLNTELKELQDRLAAIKAEAPIQVINGSTGNGQTFQVPGANGGLVPVPVFGRPIVLH